MDAVFENHFDKAEKKTNIYIIFLLAVVASVFLISYIVFFRILLKTNVSYMKNNVMQFTSSIENIDRTTNNLLTQIFFDEDIQLITRGDLSDKDVNVIHKRLSFYKNSDVYIESVNVYDTENDYMLSSESFGKNRINPNFYEDVSQTKRTLSYKYDDAQKRRLYSYKLKPYKYMPYVVEINYFFNKFAYGKNDDFVYIIYDRNENILINSSDNKDVTEMIDKIIGKNDDAYIIRRINGKRQLVFWNKTDDNIYICYTSYSHVMNKMLISFVIIAGIFVLLGAIIFFGFIKGMKWVKKFFRHLGAFERDFELVYKKKDEIDKLRFIENSDKFNQKALDKNIEKYGLGKDFVYNMIMFKIDRERAFTENISIKEQEAIKFSIANVFEEMMSEYPIIMTVTNNNELIFVYKGGSNVSVYDIIRQTQGFIKEKLDISFSAFICTRCVAVKDFSTAYAQLQKLKEYRLYYGICCILCDSEIPAERKMVNISHCWSELLVKFSEKKLNELESTYLSVVESISDIPPKEFVMANKLLIFELISIVKNTKIEISADLSLFLESIDDMETKEDITNRFISILKKAQTFKSEIVTVENNELVHQIVEYIEDNCSDSLLCREGIAEEFNGSVRKIDSVFKDVMCISVTNYIKEYRLKKAAEYLTGTELPVSDITKMVGFTTDSHFVCTFRKKFGMTPITYRKMNAEK